MGSLVTHLSLSPYVGHPLGLLGTPTSLTYCCLPGVDIFPFWSLLITIVESSSSLLGGKNEFWGLFFFLKLSSFCCKVGFPLGRYLGFIFVSKFLWMDFFSVGNWRSTEHADTIPLAFFLVLLWYFGKEGVYLCGGHVNALFTSPTTGSVLGPRPQLLCEKFVLVMVEAVFPKGQWLRASEMLRLAIAGRHETSVMVTLAWGLRDGLAELSLELYCGLRYFHSTFLPFLLLWESDLHPKSPSLPGFLPIFSYKCSPWYIFHRSNPALLSASQKRG